MIRHNLLLEYLPTVAQERIDTERAYGRRHYRDNRDRALYNKRLYTHRQLLKGLCVLCPKKAWREGARHCEKHRKDMHRFNHESSDRLKLEIFDHYGGRFCKCCKVDLIEFLSVHHANGDGARHRREVLQGKRLYQWLRRNKFPPGFEVMCMNCNFALGHFGYCPHAGKGA